MKLKGQVALVTGAGSGIGAAVARALGREGANLVLTGRRKEPLEDMKKEIEANGVPVFAHPCDVRSADQVFDLKETALSFYGHVDVLINSAGVALNRPILESSEEDFERLFDTNVKGVFLCSKAFVPDMVKRGKGSVVMISSLSGKRPFIGGGIYSATKFAVQGISEVLRQEVRREGVRVIVICPGTVHTALFNSPGFGEYMDSLPGDLQPQDVAETIVGALTLPERALVSELEIRPAIP